MVKVSQFAFVTMSCFDMVMIAILVETSLKPHKTECSTMAIAIAGQIHSYRFIGEETH
jgi:hypothetical protein